MGRQGGGKQRLSYPQRPVKRTRAPSETLERKNDSKRSKGSKGKHGAGTRKKKHAHSKLGGQASTHRGYVEESCACVERLPADALGHVLAFLHAQEAEQLLCSSRALRGCKGRALVSTFSMTRALPPSSSSSHPLPLVPCASSSSPSPPPVGPCTRLPALLSAQQCGVRALCGYAGLRTLELDLSLLPHRDILALATQVPGQVEVLRLFSPCPERRGQGGHVHHHVHQGQGGGKREVVPRLTVHSAKAYATLIQHCPRLTTLHIHNHRWSEETFGVLGECLSRLPLLQSLDVSVNMLRVDHLCTAALLQIRGPLKHLTLRLLFRPDQQLDDDDEEEEEEDRDEDQEPPLKPGEGLARLAQSGVLRCVERLCLVPEELYVGLPVEDMVWTDTHRLAPLLHALAPTPPPPPLMLPSGLMLRGPDVWSSVCPCLTHLEVGEFLSPVAFAALLHSLATPAPTPLASQLTCLKLYRINGNENHEHLQTLAQLLHQGLFVRLQELHVRDVSSTVRVGLGRVPFLHTLTQAAAHPSALPSLTHLNLRNSGLSLSDFKTLLGCPKLEWLDVSNEADLTIFNYNAVGANATTALHHAQRHANANARQADNHRGPIWPVLRTLRMGGQRLVPDGLGQLGQAMAKGAMPRLCTLDLAKTTLGHDGAGSLAKALWQCPHPLPHLKHLTLPAPSSERQSAGLRSLVSCCGSVGEGPLPLPLPLPGLCTLGLSDEDGWEWEESEDDEWRHAHPTAQAAECCRRREHRAHTLHTLRRELGLLGPGHRLRLHACTGTHTMDREARAYRHSGAPDHAYCR